MERCSYFIENKALFGSYPTQETVNYLETMGVVCFVDLTNKDETNITKYSTKVEYVNYPILDRKIPLNWKTFAKLILDCCEKIKQLKVGEKIYIHCKGGHGRSGILVACILCYYNNLSVEESFDAFTAAANTYHFAKKPASGGTPASENINIAKAKAKAGFVRERPASSLMSSR